MARRNPAISVIIPALNEEKYIRSTLEALEKQQFRDFEVIVADGRSTDKTARIARKHAKVVIDYGKNAASGRNSGAKSARGTILVFIDADTRPSTGLLESYHKAFADKNVAVATGPIHPLEKSSLMVRLGYWFVSVSFVKLSILMGNPAIVGSNFAVSAKEFRNANGFDERLATYEDWDLSKRLKGHGKTRYCDDAAVYTSNRRIVAWGIWGYFIFYVINIIMYHMLKRSLQNYKKIR
jgi:glycosyltransferase involved in cell wall biosynthesis